ncbi:MAG: hypothetical protein HN390_04980 [Anaerolineae bacterium]|jgi:hypothetical protein|nr:hypothetical protein [Anaerolineae bacterium]MBT7189670.1 hypothetical protein [Anaerolineae bacterium]
MKKPITKQIFSYVGIGLGSIGLLLCLAVIVAAWWVNTPFTYRLLYQVFPPIEAALSFGDEKATELNDFVTDVQTQVTQVTDAKPLATALEDEIEQVAVYADMAYATTDSAEQMLSSVETSPKSERAENIISEITARLTGVLDGLTDTLDETQSLAQDIQNGRDDKVGALTEQLDTLQSQTSEVQAAVEKTQSDVAVIKSKVPRWVNIGSMTVTLVFVWFGAAQYFLFRAGWQFLRKSKVVGDEGSDKINALNEQISSLQTQLKAFKTHINQDD